MRSNRFRFPASSTLGFYVVLDTHTGQIVPGITVHGNHLTNDNPAAREFVAECDLWVIRAGTIDLLSKKLELILATPRVSREPS